MNYAITVTPGLLIGGFLALCAGIVTVNKALDAILGWINRAKNPERMREAEIAAMKARIDTLDVKIGQTEDRINEKIEDRLRQAEIRLENGDKKFEVLEEGTHVLLRAQLALLSHAIDGNNEEEMKTARADLNKYLIER